MLQRNLNSSLVYPKLGCVCVVSVSVWQGRMPYQHGNELKMFFFSFCSLGPDRVSWVWFIRITVTEIAAICKRLKAAQLYGGKNNKVSGYLQRVVFRTMQPPVFTGWLICLEWILTCSHKPWILSVSWVLHYLSVSKRWRLHICTVA